MADQHRGFLFILISSLGFGSLGVWSKLGYQSGLTPLNLLSYRFTFAAIILWVIALILNPRSVRINLNSIFKLFIQGGILYALTSTCFFYALKYLPVALASILFYLHPVFTFLISCLFFKEKISLQRWASLCLTIIGVVMLTGINAGNFNISLLGIIFAVLGGLTYSFFSISNQYLKVDCNGFISTLYTTTFCAITLNILTRTTFLHFFSLNLQQSLIVIGISVIGTIVGILGLIGGIKLVGSAQAAIYTAFEPLSSTVYAIIFLNEYISSIQMMGILLILTGVIMLEAQKRKQLKLSARLLSD